MSESKQEAKRPEGAGGRVIGLDMHPDSFTAAALEGKTAMDAQVLWVHDNQPQQRLEKWLEKHVEKGVSQSVLTFWEPSCGVQRCSGREG
jgi:hypothetical protein